MRLYMQKSRAVAILALQICLLSGLSTAADAQI